MISNKSDEVYQSSKVKGRDFSGMCTVNIEGNK